jgi:hypothetical protein
MRARSPAADERQGSRDLAPRVIQPDAVGSGTLGMAASAMAISCRAVLAGQSPYSLEGARADLAGHGRVREKRRRCTP